jgi:hypothetical protein
MLHRARSGEQSSTVLPRLAAISAGVFIASAHPASRAPCCRDWSNRGSWLTTLVTPITSKTARIGPPAMMPVPSGRGQHDAGSAVLAHHRVMNRAVTQADLDHVAARRFHGLLHSDRHFTRLALAHANAPSPSPTTVSAAKPRIRPPFTTLVTRLTAIIFSRRPSSRPSSARGVETLPFALLPDA